MNEEDRKNEFITGCLIGFAFLLSSLMPLCAAVILGIGWFRELWVNPQDGSILPYIFLSLLWLVPFIGIILILKIFLAFRRKRFYYGMGLLSVLLIPLLFFGGCAMFAFKASML